MATAIVNMKKATKSAVAMNDAGVYVLDFLPCLTGLMGLAATAAVRFSLGLTQDWRA